MLYYRGISYTPSKGEAQQLDADLTYRGVDYNPANREQFEVKEQQLTYRGVSYTKPGFNPLVNIQARSRREALLAAARKAFTRNLSSSAVV